MVRRPLKTPIGEVVRVTLAMNLRVELRILVLEAKSSSKLLQQLLELVG